MVGTFRAQIGPMPDQVGIKLGVKLRVKSQAKLQVKLQTKSGDY